MKSLCTKGILYFSLALLVATALGCTQTRPVVPTPTLVPLANETVAPPNLGNPTPIIVQQVTPAPGADATLVVPPPTGGETAVPPTTEGGVPPPTPIIVEPTLFPTPTTVGDTGQPVPTPQGGGQPPTGATGSCTNPYTVQAGDWLYKIARNCGVTFEALVAANPGVQRRALRAGQTLNLPGGTSNPTPPPPPTPDTGQPIPPTPSGSCSNPYIVRSGDTLFSIAQRCNTTVIAIQQANGIPSPDYIFPGQQLRIP